MGILTTVVVALITIGCMLALMGFGRREEEPVCAAPESKPVITNETLDYLAYEYEKSKIRQRLNIDFELFVDYWQNGSTLVMRGGESA